MQQQAAFLPIAERHGSSGQADAFFAAREQDQAGGHQRQNDHGGHTDHGIAGIVHQCGHQQRTDQVKAGVQQNGDVQPPGPDNGIGQNNADSVRIEKLRDIAVEQPEGNGGNLNGKGLSIRKKAT